MNDGGPGRRSSRATPTRERNPLHSGSETSLFALVAFAGLTLPQCLTGRDMLQARRFLAALFVAVDVNLRSLKWRQTAGKVWPTDVGGYRSPKRNPDQPASRLAKLARFCQTSNHHAPTSPGLFGDRPHAVRFSSMVGDLNVTSTSAVQLTIAPLGGPAIRMHFDATVAAGVHLRRQSLRLSPPVKQPRMAYIGR